MCGISGYALKNNDQIPAEDLVRKMTETLNHRGPDGEGFFCDFGVALGMKRLSIIDVNRGNQPIFNEDKSVIIVCNGEIYNYIELRKELEKKGHQFYTNSDVEVIVHLYEDYGAKCLEFLRGMFAFAIWDKQNETLFLARDRFGIKPLNYAVTEEGDLYFGSEYKAILASGRVPKEINFNAVYDLFTYGFVKTPRTMLKNVQRLSPGHYLSFKKGNIHLHKYWDIHFPNEKSKPKRSQSEWSELLCAKLEETAKIHLRSDVELSGWLSAGIDSSSVMAISESFLKQPITTYSLIFEGNYKHDEASREKLLHEYGGFNITNERITCADKDFGLLPKALWYLEDPLTAGAPILHTVLSKQTSGSFKVVLTGEGSDELLGGYPWYRFNRMMRPFSLLPRNVRSVLCLERLMKNYKRWPTQVFMAPRKMDLGRYAQLIGLFEPDVFTKLFSTQLKNHDYSIQEMQEAKPSKESWDDWTSFEQLQYMENKTRLCDFIIHNLDRMSMAQSLEARVPFLDHEFAELTFQIPTNLKLKRHKEKYILRKAMEKYLPKEIVNRKKQGLMAPVSRWFEIELPEFAKVMLSEKQIADKGYFEYSFVSKMLKMHRQNKWNYARPLMAVLGVQLWDEIFL